jgi:hypothetical protein
MDLAAMASAVATRFAAAAITPPSGYTDPGTAVYELPSAITTTPTAVVFPPEGVFTYALWKRSGNVEFPVRWYVAPLEEARSTRALYDWAGVLIDQLETDFDLDLSPTVTHAVISGFRFGKLEYAGIEYHGIEMAVVVHTEEPFTPST